ncbi:hypothetical protein [Leptolyngbya ohadii]|uniref:hypothetical protein n=1 Tax=Leptolyngbya ohadii TaxID=1962290 RepID=UPI0015C599E2|nr:hypothetical protein [Leptolyngbya ohadii]
MLPRLSHVLTSTLILPLAATAFSPFMLIQTQKADAAPKPGIMMKDSTFAIEHSMNQGHGKSDVLLVQSPAAQAYEIRLDAPFLSNIGDRFRLSSQDSAVTTSRLIDGDRVEETVDKSGLELVAEVTVLTIDSEQQATSLSLRVIRSTANQNDTETVPFSAGTTIIASIQNGTMVFSINGKVIEGSLAESLSNIVDLNNEDDDDAAFGTLTPKRIGESWSVNPEYMAASFPDVNPQNIRGTMMLNDVTDGFLLISGLVQIDNALSAKLPPDRFTVEQDEAVLELITRLPLDTTNQNLDRTMKFTSSVQASVKTNPSVRMEIFYESSNSLQIRSIE